MQILLKVNQQAAFRRGINANASTVKLDIDPAILTQTERDVLAAVLIDGHDATRLGIQSEPDEIVGQAWYGTNNYSNGNPTKPLVLQRPDLDGLREAIQVMLDERTAMRMSYLAELAAKQGKAKTTLDALMDEPATQVSVWLREDGSETDGSDKVIRITYPKISTYHTEYYNLSPDDLARYNTWKSSTETQNNSAKRDAIAVARPEFLRLVKERQEKRSAEAKAKADAEAKAKAERESMIDRLPDLFRARIEAGYAKSDEIDAAIRRLARADAGLTHDAYKVSRLLEAVTDEEFSALECVKAAIATRLPDADVEPMEVADKFGGYRKPTLDDDPDDIDDDGDVWEDDVNLRRRIVVTFTRAGLTIKTAVPFTPITVN